jgi:probable O-glycosylation ligase (exosortase A-associated)
MKHLLFMIVLTFAGTAGVFLYSPFWGVAVYYLFAVLRPQFIWEWTLPQGVNWSLYVALATMLGLSFSHGAEGSPKLTFAHRAVLIFGGWICITFFTATNSDVAYPFFVEYLKIFVFFFVASKLIQTTHQIWCLFIMTALALGYIAYEINAIYFFQGGFLYIYRRGYGGLDNNGAALMVAMGVPLCYFAWEGIRRWYRWLFLALIPPLIHAMLMAYSRGAMLSLIAAVPVIFLRSRKKRQIVFILGAIVFMIPILAGKEIQERFFSISQSEVDASAQSRWTSWAIGWRLANENAIFGLGIRNSNLYTHYYGADIEGRTIHSQYLQTAADSGLVALGLYLMALGAFWLSTRRMRRAVAGRHDPEARRIHAIAGGVVCSMVVFCVGAIFLSLENFELPYLLLLLGCQLVAVYRPLAANADVANSQMPTLAFWPELLQRTPGGSPA